MRNFGESRFPGSSQIPNPVKIFSVFPNPAPFFGQIPDPENTLPDPGSIVQKLQFDTTLAISNHFYFPLIVRDSGVLPTVKDSSHMLRRKTPQLPSVK